MKRIVTPSVPIIDFSSASELKPYLCEPTAMYVGAPGKHGYLKLHFELDSDGRSILREVDRRVPLIAQKALYFDKEMPDMPCLYILSSGGPNVDGDRYQQDIVVGKNAYAWISTGAATKIASMKHNYSAMVQNIRLECGAYLEFLPEPVIPCRNSRFISDTRLSVDESATLFYSEIYLCGRKFYSKPEVFDYDLLSVCCRGERLDGKNLFREKFIIEPKLYNPRRLGVMSYYDTFANVVVMAPENIINDIYDNTYPRLGEDSLIAECITTLPNNAGLMYKVLGCDTSIVKQSVRNFCSKVRMAVKGKQLPKEFPWR